MSNKLSEWTTLGVGGYAADIHIALSRAELEKAAGAFIIGGGSNLLCSDDGYDGTVVINRYESMECAKGLAVFGSGTRLPKLCAFLAENGLSGLEWACGIPGSVGGAVKMNAGAFGGQIADRLVYADVLRGGNVMRLSRDELGLGYRSSNISNDDIVLSAAFALDDDSPANIRKRSKEFAARRISSQPAGKSAGSIFKNPPGISVGKALSQAGLNGLTIGGAQISQCHANIIINTGNARARDVYELIGIMKNTLNVRGIPAEEEIIYVGGW